MGILKFAAGGVEMFLAESGPGAELACVVPARRPRVRNDPHGNAGAGKAGVAPADAGCAHDERILSGLVKHDDLHFRRTRGRANGMCGEASQ